MPVHSFTPQHTLSRCPARPWADWCEKRLVLALRELPVEEAWRDACWDGGKRREAIGEPREELLVMRGPRRVAWRKRRGIGRRMGRHPPAQVLLGLDVGACGRFRKPQVA